MELLAGPTETVAGVLAGVLAGVPTFPTPTEVLLDGWVGGCTGT